MCHYDDLCIDQQDQVEYFKLYLFCTYLSEQFHAVIDIDDILCGFEQLTHVPGCLDLPLVVEAIDLNHQRGHHRRAGRHLDHLDIAVVLAGDRLQRPSHSKCDFVAFTFAIMLVDQIDLDIPQAEFPGSSHAEWPIQSPVLLQAVWMTNSR